MKVLDRREGRQADVIPSDIMPDGWRVAPLKRFFRVVGGATPTSDPENWDGDIPWVTPGDLSGLDTFYIDKGKRSISERGHRSCSTELVPEGSVIVSTRAPIGSLAIAQERLCTNQGCKALVPTTTVDSRFFAYALSVATPQLNALGQGSTFRELAGESLGSFRLPVPSHQEQGRIAAFLDHETARIDELVREQELLLGFLEEKRSATVSALVTRGLNEDVKMEETGLAWWPSAPQKWQVVPIRALAKPGRASFTDGDWIEAPYITDDGVRLIQTGNIGVGHYVEQGYRHISEESFRKLRCTEVFPGDVLICRLADPVGRACLAPDLGKRMVTSVDVCILRPHAGVSAKYLTYLMSSAPYLGALAGEMRGGTRDRVSRSFLGSFRVVMPPLSEQLAIVRKLDEAVGRLDGLRDEVHKNIGLLLERRSALISAAVTGQLDLRDWQPSEPEAVAEVS